MPSASPPAGYSTVSPYLIVNGANETLAFLSQVFAGEILRRIGDESGRIFHSEIRVGDTVIMVADEAEAWPAQPAHVHIYVADVDDTYRRALAAGATSVQVPSQQGDEDKRGGVKDSAGTTWWIATRVG